jgi:hypothetical protein
MQKYGLLTTIALYVQFLIMRLEQAFLIKTAGVYQKSSFSMPISEYL